MKLAVGFLLYKEASAKYLADFLPSLKQALAFLDSADFKIFAFDNSDAENLENRLAIEKFNSVNDNLIDYSTKNTNLGFGRAYNILINRAQDLKAEYFLILNPDMLIDSEAIRNLIKGLNEDRGISAVSAKIYYWDFLKSRKTKIIDSLGLIVKSGLRFYDLGQGQKDRGQFDNLQIIGPSGAAGLFRLSDLDKIAFIKETGNKQYFDERFFMYKEDCDLAYRFYLSGLKSKIIPDAIFYHDRSSGSDNQSFLRKLLNRSKKSRQIRAWSLKNQNILYSKYWKNQSFVNKILIVFWFLGSLIFSLILEQYNLKNYFRKN